MKEKGCFENLYSHTVSFKTVYFDIQVLKRYFEDPKYLVFYSDYRGTIALKDKYADEKAKRSEYLKNFGLAYNKNDFNDRAIVTFAEELIKLPIRMQSHFHSFYLDNQEDYYPNSSFIKNLVYGDWVTDISIYQALLMEIHYINQMCAAIGIPPMFLKEFSWDTILQNDRPTDFHVLLMPTEKKYYDFVITLEKMIIGNLNIKTFMTPACLIEPVERKNAHGEDKGSLTMLLEWIATNVSSFDAKENIGVSLRALRKERQNPAHRIFVDTYDKSFWKKQNDFMQKVYTAVRNIRLVMANHPLCKNIEIPSELFDGKHIILY